MAQINLLPWREERRQNLKKEFLASVALVLVARRRFGIAR